VIAAELNMLSGATVPDDVAAALAAAHDLIDAKNILTDSVPTGGPGNTLGPAMIALKDVLDLYNNGAGDVTHCPEDEEAGE